MSDNNDSKQKKAKEKKNASRFNVLHNKADKLLKILMNDEEFMADITNDDGTLNDIGIKYITNHLNDILKQGIIVNNAKPIVNEENYGITKNQQLEKANEYFRSILSKININDNIWGEFLVNILNLGLIDNSPFSLQIDSNITNPNILSNVAWYIANNIQPKDAKIYSNDEGHNIPSGSKRDVRDVKNEYTELLKQQQNNQQQEVTNMKTTISEQGETIAKGQKLVNRLMDENSKIREENEEQKELIEKLKIPRSELDSVKSDIHKLSTKNQLDILNGIALTYAADPSLKQHIGNVKKSLKADTKLELDDNQINYIISKALSENDRYLKTVAANPDLFDRDMSPSTIQNENEQFQSKLRQQNLRYILPKFIERREKLVENTLNPELLKGAFAI